MKATLCFALVVLLAFSGVQGHRRLRQQVTRSSAMAVSIGGGNAVATSGASNGGSSSAVATSMDDSSATAISTAEGEGADATSVAGASGGADVTAETNVESEGGADVAATTVVMGDGPQTTSASADVTSDKDISIVVFVNRVTDGEDLDVVAKEVVVKLGEGTNAQVLAALREGLSGDENSAKLFFRVIELLFDGKDCDADIRPVFAGSEGDFIVYNIPIFVSECVYASCSGIENAKFCCGEAQLEQEFCSCGDGGCAWQQPANQNSAAPYWECLECGVDVDYCVCR